MPQQVQVDETVVDRCDKDIGVGMSGARQGVGAARRVEHDIIAIRHGRDGMIQPVAFFRFGGVQIA